MAQGSRIQLDEGRRAAEAGDWLAAGHAFVRAAMEGSTEDVALAVRVTVELVPLADGGSAEAATLLAGGPGAAEALIGTALGGSRN
ncbi:hypothetical protein [Streptomyces sp. NPDC002520]